MEYTHLTIVIRNDAPMCFAGDCPSYRRVTVELTPEQSSRIELRVTGRSGGVDLHESISHVFLERLSPNPQADEGDES
jgi:hypothetical protein